MSIFQLERDGDVDELLRLLREGRRPEIRERAAETLGGFDDHAEEITEGLIAAATDDDSQAVQAAAIDALSELGRNSIERLLAEMAGIDVDPESTDRIGVEAFVQALDRELPELRMAAANAIGHVGDPSAVPALIERLDDDNARVRARAARACGRIGDPRAVDPLCERTTDAHAGVRREAVEALGEIRGEAAKGALLDRLEDGSEWVRRSAVTALGNFDDPGLVERLADMLHDDADVVRRAAVYSIIDLLANAPADRSHEMRETAVEVLSATADREVIGPLVEIQQESRQSTHRRNAVWLLGRIAGDDPDRRVLRTLAEALADEDPMVSQFATTGLADIGGERVEAVVLDLLEDDLRPEATANAVFALGKIGGERSRDRIDALIDETDSEEVREQAFSALSKLDGRFETANTAGEGPESRIDGR